MSERMVQPSLFEESSFPIPAPRNANQWAHRHSLLTEEIRLGKWDYERLLPNRTQYEETVKRYKGFTKFNNKQVQYDVMEARAVIRFLKNWSEREDQLEIQIEECLAEIRKLTE